METLVGVAAAVVVVWTGLILGFRQSLRAVWEEPAFRTPVLILESDDWGPAPPTHAAALSAIAAVLRTFRDDRGHPPVMTLGIVLAIPDGLNADAPNPAEITLGDPCFAPILASMRAGVRDGVFQLQLHGRSHYWLDALTKARSEDPAVASWLAGPDTWRSEDLPAGLQSRYGPVINDVAFPIHDDAVRIAAESEARLFEQCLGVQASVAVPTTFVWRPAVEQGWAAAGIRTMVTPGRRYRHRAQFANPDSVPLITNGMHGNDMLYVVRDRYFEPFRGHTARDGLRAVADNTELGRPTLLEIHRVNFVDDTLRARSLAAVRDLLEGVLAEHPNVRFLSTIELADSIRARATELIDCSSRFRILKWCARVRAMPRFWKLARLSGFALVITVLAKVAR